MNNCWISLVVLSLSCACWWLTISLVCLYIKAEPCFQDAVSGLGRMLNWFHMAQIFVVNYGMCDIVRVPQLTSQLILFRIEQEAYLNFLTTIFSSSLLNLLDWIPQTKHLHLFNPPCKLITKWFSTFQCTIFVFNVLIVCSRFLGGIQQISDNCKLFKKNLPSVGHLCLFDCNALWLHAMYVVCWLLLQDVHGT